MGDDIGVGNMAGEGEIHGDAPLAGPPLLFQELGQRAGIVETAREDVVDGFGEEGVAVEIEQLRGPRRQGAQGGARSRASERRARRWQG